ncbi:hypothetical protein K439DRAFT_1630532 [Ramaria rubella]|nr:hypothetical protein K439DRAFT_1641890 [Ramaria rubella]KAF8587544.1 hypothetical protein K439DRAFT_1630532 [Ramaria rubella]
METIFENGVVPQHITEDEAALYDRQIRLWGLEAQQRMRNATICVMNLRGVATEVIKNIVLAGIGKVVILDPEDIQEEDLGAGFFFRESDVGLKRVDAAKSRIEILNPLVTVESVTSQKPLDWWDTLVQSVDIFCLTDGSQNDIVRINDLCRKHKKPFYAGGSYGLTGYIFCDLLDHEYIAPDRSPNVGQTKTIKHRVTYPSFSEALKHDWQSLTKKQAKHQNAELVFSIFALWKYQTSHHELPSEDTVTEVAAISKSFIQSMGVKAHVMQSVPSHQLGVLVSTAMHEFSPVCAVLGGLMGQDMLKALGGRDPPIANFFVFDGQTGSGAVSRLNMPV